MFYAGDELRITVSFTDQASGALTDPTGVDLRWQDVARTAQVVTKTLADLTQDSTGVWHIDVDTTDLVAGTWNVQVVSTGAVAAANVTSFIIEARPLG